VKSTVCFRRLEIPTDDQQSSIKILTFYFKVALLSQVVFSLSDCGRPQKISESSISVATYVYFKITLKKLTQN